MHTSGPRSFWRQMVLDDFNDPRTTADGRTKGPLHQGKIDKQSKDDGSTDCRKFLSVLDLTIATEAASAVCFIFREWSREFCCCPE